MKVIQTCSFMLSPWRDSTKVWHQPLINMLHSTEHSSQYLFSFCTDNVLQSREIKLGQSTGLVYVSSKQSYNLMKM